MIIDYNIVIILFVLVLYGQILAIEIIDLYGLLKSIGIFNFKGHPLLKRRKNENNKN
jgi:hypothetical protein